MPQTRENLGPRASDPPLSSPATLTPDVAIFSQRGSPDVSTTSLEPVFRPGSFFDGPGAGKRPPGAENVEKPPGAIFPVAWI